MQFDADVEQTAEKLQNLSDDFRKFKCPKHLQSLEPGVTLSNWILTTGVVYVVRGEVAGHPYLKDGPIETSQLFFLDQTLGLARTLSRWYRLGAPLDLGLNKTRQ